MRMYEMYENVLYSHRILMVIHLKSHAVALKRPSKDSRKQSHVYSLAPLMNINFIQCTIQSYETRLW